MDKDHFRKLVGIGKRSKSDFFKFPGEDKNIYPGTFTHVLVDQGRGREFTPMRYRVRPAGSKEEVPSKFNVFNARMDSLESRQTWKPLFMRNHGVFFFNYFYEWVEREEGKKLIKFIPEGREVMWAPCLWDEWRTRDGQFQFSSFALITTDPPAEVEALGHDRCPIFLREDYFDSWLNPRGETKDEIYALLEQKEDVIFKGEFAS